MKAGPHRLPPSLILVLLMGASTAPAQLRNEPPPLKEMDLVRTLYLAPFSTELYTRPSYLRPPRGPRPVAD